MSPDESTQVGKSALVTALVIAVLAIALIAGGIIFVLQTSERINDASTQPQNSVNSTSYQSAVTGGSTAR